MTYTDFPLKAKDIDLISQYADEFATGSIPAFEFANEILFSKDIAPAFDINKWITASKELLSRAYIVERIFENLDLVKDFL